MLLLVGNGMIYIKKYALLLIRNPSSELVKL